jgi:predicted acetyltransferase
VEIHVRVELAQLEDTELLQQLLEFNAYEFSRLVGADLDAQGRFGYLYLDHLDRYWTEPGLHPFLIRVEGRIAGMVLVREGTPHRIAEFLVMPKYRRRGAGATAARELFGRFPGAWEVHEMRGNDDAVTFWRRVIPAEFTETHDDHGTTQHFVVSTGPGSQPCS